MSTEYANAHFQRKLSDRQRSEFAIHSGHGAAHPYVQRLNQNTNAANTND